MNIPYVFKRCTKCGEWLIANNVNFYKSKLGKYKLASDCIACRRQHTRKTDRINNQVETKIVKGVYYKKCTHCGEWKIANLENFNKHTNCKLELSSKCKNCLSEYGKQHFKSHKKTNKMCVKNEIKTVNGVVYKKCNKCEEWLIADKHNFYIDKDKQLGLSSRCKECKKNENKQYRITNLERVRNTERMYNKNNRLMRLNYNYKRRQKEESQGDGITKEQWKECMQWFNWECAYSGIPLQDKNRTIDHIVPISMGGDNMVWNMIPMDYRCNCSKNNKNMVEWYKQQDFYSEERLQKIYEWQEYAYNKWSCKTIEVQEA